MVRCPLLLTGIFLLQGVLFCNPRLICGHVHAGVFGFIPAVLTGMECILRIPALEADSGETFTFTFSLTIFLLMSTRLLPGLREEMRSTFSGAGEILSIIVLLYAGMAATVNAEHVEYFILFIFLLTVGCICFGIARNHPLTKDTPLCVAQTAMVFVAAVLAAQSDTPAYPLLLVCAALVLLVQFLLSRRVWTLVLGLCASYRKRSLQYAGNGCSDQAYPGRIHQGEPGGHPGAWLHSLPDNQAEYRKALPLA